MCGFRECEVNRYDLFPLLPAATLASWIGQSQKLNSSNMERECRTARVASSLFKISEIEDNGKSIDFRFH